MGFSGLAKMYGKLEAEIQEPSYESPLGGRWKGEMTRGLYCAQQVLVSSPSTAPLILHRAFIVSPVIGLLTDRHTGAGRRQCSLRVVFRWYEGCAVAH